ncbi:unnamed protein product [marine sediment metagenome]|uniref:Uncharacterized protein n=1 Tax=marine sediment metagenome TaxID=412755 RepID=X1RXW9_9ZZZZ
MSNLEHFAIMDIYYFHTPDTIIITLPTNNPCHLTSTDGVFYLGANKIATTQQDTSPTGPPRYSYSLVSRRRRQLGF